MKHRIAMSLILALSTPAVWAGGFSVSSPQLKSGGRLALEQVFNSFGCTGQNVSPALNWTNPPTGTQSYAITVYDPDAPTGSGWWHWVVFNIPASATGVPKNAGDLNAKLLPAGSVQSRTDFGTPGYGGGCPPAGDKPHRYFFTVHALKTDKLPLDENASGAMVGFYLGQNTLGKATIQVKYSR